MLVCVKRDRAGRELEYLDTDDFTQEEYSVYIDCVRAGCVWEFWKYKLHGYCSLQEVKAILREKLKGE